MKRLAALLLVCTGCAASSRLKGAVWLDAAGGEPIRAQKVYLCPEGVLEGDRLTTIPGGLAAINFRWVLRSGNEMRTIAERSCSSATTDIRGEYDFVGAKGAEVFSFYESPTFAAYWRVPIPKGAKQVDLHDGNTTDFAKPP